MSITPRPADGYAGDITPQQAWELLRDDPAAVLVDVRTDGEWRTIGVPDTADLGKTPVFAQWSTATGPNPAFLEQIAAAGVSGGPVVFLCRSGQRSIGAARAATAAGIGPSYNVLEGFEGAPGIDGVRDREGWKVAGLPWGGYAPTGSSTDGGSTDGSAGSSTDGSTGTEGTR